MRDTKAGVIGSMEGCWTCHGGDAKWYGKNALAVAAPHHDATGHATWCEQTMSVRYGKAPVAETTP